MMLIVLIVSTMNTRNNAKPDEVYVSSNLSCFAADDLAPALRARLRTGDGSPGLVYSPFKGSVRGSIQA